MSWPRHKPSQPLSGPENAPQPPSQRYPHSLLGRVERYDLADSLTRFQACEAAITAELAAPDEYDAQQLADEAEAGYDLHQIHRREHRREHNAGLTGVDGGSRA